MSKAVEASGVVHWIGAGLSTGRGLELVSQDAKETLIWARTPQRANVRLARLGLTGRVAVQELTTDRLRAAVRPGDVVVSMLPATEHVALMRLCSTVGAHFACSSYTSPEMADVARVAAARGLVTLTEAGLDPGIDHLMAHILVEQARAAVGDGPATIRFTSYCGGIPVRGNALRYAFSWAPRGVLHALREPARYLTGGQVREIDEPWQDTRTVTGTVTPGETLQVYPNRDSIPFLRQYGLPPAWRPEEFVRGTLRLEGWKAAWEPVFTELRGGDDEAIDALADELARTYPAGPHDQDRVVLAVRLDAVGPQHDTSFSGRYTLDMVGDGDESAMARCVSLPLAVGIGEILAGRLSAGLHRATADADRAQAWLDRLAEWGVMCVAQHG